MTRDSIAEWILATVTGPDRVATIVGDLLEQPATRKGARELTPQASPCEDRVSIRKCRYSAWPMSRCSSSRS